ncbi:MAG: alanyl-tRNA editing protein [Sphaerochaetaceae bacterium]|nr:alanyl-tRNA editing protein [Sphaerochaetaceae bacterium]
MEKVYYADNYLKEIICTVTDVQKTDKNIQVLTDGTIFYPEGGGQPGDVGNLGNFQVLDTKKLEDGSSALILDGSCDIQVGQIYKLKLDWAHRYKFMVMHTAQHLLSGLLFNLYQIGTVAVHLGDEYLTIELDKSEIEEEQIEGLICAANAAIEEGHRILYHQLSHSAALALGMRRSIKVEGDVRVVEIEGIDKIACGGVHVANTKEIRLIYCLGQEQIRGHVRLFFCCGETAVFNTIANAKAVSIVNSKLSCKTAEIEEKLSSLITSFNEIKAQKTLLAKKIAYYELKEAINDAGICLIDCEEGTDIQPYGQALSLFDDMALCILCPDGNRTKWLIGLKGKFEKINFNEIRNKILSSVNAKGGGKTPLFQGVAECTDSEKLKSFKEGFIQIVSESV